MTWAILGIGTLLVIVLVVLIVRLTVTVSKQSANASAMAIAFDQRAHAEREAQRQQVQGLIDRLMSMDWQAVRGYELAEETEPGGFIPPDEQSDDEVTQIIPNWGSVDTHGQRADLLDEVQAMAEEDDLDSRERERMASS